MKFIRGFAVFLTLTVTTPLTGAELAPIPPVAIPRTGSSVPETQPPVAQPPVVAPPVTPLVSYPPGSVPPSTPPGSMPPPSEVPLASLPPPVMVATQPAESVPATSVPLHPVSPETVAETQKKIEEEGIYFNVADEEIREVIKQISRALGKNFILDDKVKGKITIISERKMTKDEVWEAFQSALEVMGFTVVEGPAGLLRLVPTRDAIAHPIELYTEASPFTDRFITRLLTPKNISAADTANVIKNLVSKEGNLIAYPATNTLILTDTGTNIDRLIKLINQLDHEGPQQILEIIPLTYADAKDVAGKLDQIFEVQKGSSNAPRPGKKPGEGGEEEAIQKILPDERTNSLIVLASKTAIQKVRDLIKKLDAPLPGPAEGEVHVYYLKHANAKDMATVLTAISSAVKSKEGKDKGSPNVPADAASVISGVTLSGKWTVTADESTNALVITSSPKDFQVLIDQVISKLDIPRRQVYVEAVIVELSVSENQQLGVGAIGGKSFNAGGGNQIAAFGSTFGFLDVTRLLGGSLGGGSSNSITINQPSSGTGTASTITVPAFFAALQLAQGNNQVNILSTPNILTLDNQEAEIKVGQKVPFPAASATTIGGSLQTTFTREDVTLSLKIKPQISESDTIRMEVTQDDKEILPPDQQPQTSIQAGPSTTERSIKTAIVANNGQTIVLGGLIKDKYTTAINKVPLLGDIPIFGYLFKTRHKVKEKVNLVVFLTPHIIREPRDFLSIVQKKINEKNAFIEENYTKAQQKQIHKSFETHAKYLMEASGEMSPTDQIPIPSQAPSPSGGKPSESSPESSGDISPPPPSSSGDDLSVEEPARVKQEIKKEKKRSKTVNPTQ